MMSSLLRTGTTNLRIVAPQGIISTYCGPKPIEEVLVESEDELKEIQDSQLPTKCTDVAKKL